MEDLMSTTETTEETTETVLGEGGIVGETFVTSFDGLLDLILRERNTLVKSNQNNADLFNQLQEFIKQKTTGVTQLDGAINALSSFVTEETPEDDEHVVKLTELKSQRVRTVEEIQEADTQRRNVFNSITMTEGALQVLNQVLSKTDVGTGNDGEGVTTEA
tara:strand:+ start:2405 stop:2887 length:483 start_codon:yes stop_codon:yes gene_type:complete